MDSFEEREDPAIAARHLKLAVKHGSFMLALGAGVSHGVGLPNWSELVERCCTLTGAEFDPTRLTEVIDDAYEAGASMTPPLDRATIVRTCLYRDLPARGTYRAKDLQSPLLLALGAAIMSGARTGSTEVFTLNFDDVLESYLVAHGFSVQAITSDSFDVMGDVDVHVFHPHGYLPRKSTSRSPDLVLSQDEFLDRLADNPEQPWPSSFLSHLHSRIAIAVGLSFSDENLLTLCRRAKKYLDRPIGYSLNVHSEADVRRLRRSRIIPVRFDDHDQIPDYLLGIAKARAVNV